MGLCTGAQSGCWCFSIKESGDTGHWHECKGLLDLYCWGSRNWSHKFLFSKETMWAPNSGLAGLIVFTYSTYMGFVSRHFISQNVSGCSVVLLFEFLKNCWFWFFNFSRIKRTTGSSYFKNLTEPMGFMKEPRKNRWFFDFFMFLEHCGYVPKPILQIFWELVGKCMYTQADNWRVSTPNYRNHHSLGVSQHLLNNGSREGVYLCGGSGMQETCDPVMTAYKLVTVDAPYWGFGYRLEQAALAVCSQTLFVFLS